MEQNKGVSGQGVAVVFPDAELEEANPLSQEALCNDIPTLEGRGVCVSYVET